MLVELCTNFSSVAGKIFHVPDGNVALRNSGNRQPFYSIKAHGIIDVTDGTAFYGHLKRPSKGVQKHKSAKAKPVKQFEVSPECVICMSDDSCVVFCPCGHLCCCRNCGSKIKKCCICRVNIDSVVNK